MHAQLSILNFCLHMSHVGLAGSGRSGMPMSLQQALLAIQTGLLQVASIWASGD